MWKCDKCGKWIEEHPDNSSHVTGGLHFGCGGAFRRRVVLDRAKEPPSHRTIIRNGGDPLPGCPESFEEAEEWSAAANKGKAEGEQPRWRFDCGFKLDFDGPLLRVTSRFYPPKTRYGPKWNGAASIFLLDEEVLRREFEHDTLEGLRWAVECYVQGVTARLMSVFEGGGDG